MFPMHTRRRRREDELGGNSADSLRAGLLWRARVSVHPTKLKVEMRDAGNGITFISEMELEIAAEATPRSVEAWGGEKVGL